MSPLRNGNVSSIVLVLFVLLFNRPKHRVDQNVTMLLQRTNMNRLIEDGNAPSSTPSKRDEPLTCMIYFFASQMGRNTQTAPVPSNGRSASVNTNHSVHRLDTLLAKIGTHASFSPLITRFDTFPVEIPEAAAQSKRQKRPPQATVHDTMLLVKFRSAKAREEWIATREWRDFMQQTETEDVFRRMPHVRCARSLKGLRDPIEVLSA